MNTVWKLSYSSTHQYLCSLYLGFCFASDHTCCNYEPENHGHNLDAGFYLCKDGLRENLMPLIAPTCSINNRR
jgi:hypothetical protein